MPKTDESLFLRVPPLLKLAVGAAASIDDTSINDLCFRVLAAYVADRAKTDREYARLLFSVGVQLE